MFSKSLNRKFQKSYQFCIAVSFMLNTVMLWYAMLFCVMSFLLENVYKSKIGCFIFFVFWSRVLLFIDFNFFLLNLMSVNDFNSINGMWIFFVGCDLFEGLDYRKACNSVNSIATRPPLQSRNFVHNICKGKHFGKSKVDSPVKFLRH